MTETAARAVTARAFMDRFGGPHSRLVLKDQVKVAILRTAGIDVPVDVDAIAAASVVAVMGQIEDWTEVPARETRETTGDKAP